MTAPIGLVWAEARGGVIGADGGMPWHVPEDLAHFKAVTAGAPVIMGRRTWESFPPRFRPLPGRRNIVVTRDTAWADDGAERAGSLDAALWLADADAPARVWVIGGSGLFREAIDRADLLEVTELDLEVQGDTFAPDRSSWPVAAADPGEGWHTSRTGIRYRFLTLGAAS
ncbi:dihydrofolate reductase [Microbacterium sp. zg.Y1090]|uniref:dihydrofolate reductase n=1 Tax=Microbacterium TaxID=33882 RepID=UPI00214AA3AC|nr:MULTISPECIES: dihydrofolate reductase [unclassified Microbacterium]MCR2813393.1 dihydrofolate reductase [Microbacterium sp. zg.Y1084]MCR2818271.1 dihydrofolate reductase [Microbacterium sp. zg.Y1090]MDL5486792.1 dihydrofolate reductase [Microbacterium sp. zg-Y1211]WIM27584.1 dihydrofolate reductase [Microbacterium sp. zg-Y1090]